MPKFKVQTLFVRDGDAVQYTPDSRVIHVDTGSGLDVYITFMTELTLHPEDQSYPKVVPWA